MHVACNFCQEKLWSLQEILYFFLFFHQKGMRDYWSPEETENIKNGNRDNMKKRPLQKHDYVLWAIRGLLILSVFITVGLILLQLLTDQLVTRREIIEVSSQRVEQLFWELLTLLLTFLPDYIKKRRHIHLPHILEIAIVIFLYASIFLSTRFGLYYRFFWWDDLLHALSGLIIGFLGFILMYKLNGKYSMDISPLLVAVFAFTFAITMGVFWEIFEFSMDVFFRTAMQKWDLPGTTTLIGRPYQGSGLRDTMSDLIVDSIGALVTSILCYFLYKNEKKTALAMMHDIFPDENDRT